MTTSLKINFYSRLRAKAVKLWWNNLKKSNWCNLTIFTLVWQRFHNVMKYLVKVICYVMKYNLEKKAPTKKLVWGIGLNFVFEWALCTLIACLWSKIVCHNNLRLTETICANCVTVQVVKFMFSKKATKNYNIFTVDLTFTY